MPAVYVAADSYAGWQAALLSLQNGAAQLYSGDARAQGAALLLAVSVNISAPAWGWWQKPVPRVQWLSVLLAAGCAANVWLAARLITEPATSIGLGYVAWCCGVALLTLAPWLRPRWRGVR